MGLLGPVWTGAENLVSTGIQSPDRPAHSDYAHRVPIFNENMTV